MKLVLGDKDINQILNNVVLQKFKNYLLILLNLIKYIRVFFFFKGGEKKGKN
jgi:hypothetical protein